MRYFNTPAIALIAALTLIWAISDWFSPGIASQRPLLAYTVISLVSLLAEYFKLKARILFLPIWLLACMGGSIELLSHLAESKMISALALVPCTFLVLAVFIRNKKNREWIDTREKIFQAQKYRLRGDRSKAFHQLKAAFYSAPTESYPLSKAEINLDALSELLLLLTASCPAIEVRFIRLLHEEFIQGLLSGKEFKVEREKTRWLRHFLEANGESEVSPPPVSPNPLIKNYVLPTAQLKISEKAS